MSHPNLPSQEQGPYRPVRIRRTMDTMSMYLDVLAGSLGSWVDELTAPELVRYARACKEALESPGLYGVTTNAAILAAEIAYDRALIRLCQLHAISVDPRTFMFPASARVRIEAALRAVGVTLD